MTTSSNVNTFIQLIIDILSQKDMSSLYTKSSTFLDSKMPKFDGKLNLGNVGSCGPGYMPVSVAASTSANYLYTPRRASMPVSSNIDTDKPLINSMLPTGYYENALGGNGSISWMDPSHVQNMQGNQTQMPAPWMQNVIMPQLCAGLNTDRRASMPVINLPAQMPQGWSLGGGAVPQLKSTTEMSAMLPSISEKKPKKSVKKDKQLRYECEQCKKLFTRPSSLSTHMYTHTGEKPHQCSFPGCYKRFSVLSNLRRHSKLHQEPMVRNRRKTQSQNYYVGHPYHVFPAGALEMPSHPTPIPASFMQPQFMVQGSPGHVLANGQNFPGMPPPPLPPQLQWSEESL